MCFYPNPLAKKSYHPRSRPRPAYLTPQYMQRALCVMGRATLASISSSTYSTIFGNVTSSLVFSVMIYSGVGYVFLLLFPTRVANIHQNRLLFTPGLHERFRPCPHHIMPRARIPGNCGPVASQSDNREVLVKARLSVSITCSWPIRQLS